MARNYDPELARNNIKRLLDYRRKSSFEVSLAIGKSRTYIDDFLRGRKQGISTSAIMEISHALDISSVYIFGTHQLPEDISTATTQSSWIKQRIAKQAQFEAAFGTEEPDEPQEDSGKISLMRNIPEIYTSGSEYPEPIYTGLERVYNKNEVLGTWMIPGTIIQRQIESNEAYLDVIKVQDDAMETANGDGLRQGDRIFINRLDKNIRAGGIFAIFDNDIVLVRRINVLRGTDPVEFECLAENPRHPAFRLKLSDKVRIIGKAVAHFRLL